MFSSLEFSAPAPALIAFACIADGRARETGEIRGQEKSGLRLAMKACIPSR